MQRYFGRVIRALIVSTLGFGGGTGLLISIAMLVMRGYEHAFEYGLYAGLILGGLFAVMLVGVLLPLDLSAHLFLNKGNYEEIWELEQTRQIDIDGSFQKMLSLCREALLAVPYVKAVNEDLQALVIRASVGTSWRSFGEKMEVKITALSEGRWRLCCTSAPLSTNIVFDYGKNFDNVEAWLREIRRLQQPATTPVT